MGITVWISCMAMAFIHIILGSGCKFQCDLDKKFHWPFFGMPSYFSPSLSLTFTPIKAVGVIFGRPPVMLIPLGQPIFYRLSRLGQNPRHQTWPHHTTIYFHPPRATLKKKFVRHLTHVYFPCCFCLAWEKSRAALLITKDCVDPQGQRGKWEKM